MLRKLVSKKKLVSECIVYNMELHALMIPSTFRFKETGVKVTFKTLLCRYDHRKIVQVDFTDENRILYMVNDRTEVFIE